MTALFYPPLLQNSFLFTLFALYLKKIIMYITIQTSRMYDLSELYIANLVRFFCSLMFLHSVHTDVKSVGDNCRIIYLSSDCCTSSVLRQRCLSVFRFSHDSLPDYYVGDVHSFSSYCYFTFLNINVKLTLNS